MIGVHFRVTGKDEMVLNSFSRKTDETFIVDLLLLCNGNVYHNVLNLNLGNLVRKREDKL